MTTPLELKANIADSGKQRTHNPNADAEEPNGRQPCLTTSRAVSKQPQSSPLDNGNRQQAGKITAIAVPSFYVFASANCRQYERRTLGTAKTGRFQRPILHDASRPASRSHAVHL